MTELGRPDEIEEREIAARIDAAGPADEVPEEDVAALTAEARVAWRRMVERRRAAEVSSDVADRVDSTESTGSRSVSRWLPWAAILVLSVALALLWLTDGGGRQAPDDTVEIARLGQVEVSKGALTISHPDGATAGPLELVAGSSVLTGPDGGTTLQLVSGVEVRLADTTWATFDSAGEIDLRQGAVYLDTDAATTTLTITTPLGVVRDVGTRFAVRYAGSAGFSGEGDRLEVRVRHGAVEVATADSTWRAAAGEALDLGRSGPPERAALAPHDDAWSWVMAAGPGFEIDGRSLAAFLAWVERETGWRVRYESPRLAVEADEIELHGDLGQMPADQAAFAVLPGAGLEGELADDGVLVVRTAR